MVWLNDRFLNRQSDERSFADERLDFEQTPIGWIQELQSEKPYRAYRWADFLLNEYEIKGSNRTTVEDLHRLLGQTATNTAYLEGLRKLDEFSAEELSQTSDPAHGVITPARRFNEPPPN